MVFIITLLGVDRALTKNFLDAYTHQSNVDRYISRERSGTPYVYAFWKPPYAGGKGPEHTDSY